MDSKIQSSANRVGFFATANQMFGGSSQLLTTAVHCLFSELSTTISLSTLCSGWRLGGAAAHLIDGSER